MSNAAATTTEETRIYVSNEQIIGTIRDFGKFGGWKFLPYCRPSRNISRKAHTTPEDSVPAWARKLDGKIILRSEWEG